MTSSLSLPSVFSFSFSRIAVFGPKLCRNRPYKTRTRSSCRSVSCSRLCCWCFEDSTSPRRALRFPTCVRPTLAQPESGGDAWTCVLDDKKIDYSYETIVFVRARILFLTTVTTIIVGQLPREAEKEPSTDRREGWIRCLVALGTFVLVLSELGGECSSAGYQLVQSTGY